MFGSIFSLYSHEIGEDNSKIPHLNLVIWGLNKPIPLSFLSHVDYLNQLIILVIFQWTQSNMSLSFFLPWEEQTWKEYSICSLTRDDEKGWIPDFPLEAGIAFKQTSAMEG